MFQRAGKEHVRYIFDMAMKMWSGRNFKVPFDDCLWKSMEKHRDYITRIERAAIQFNKSKPRMGDFAHRDSALND